MDPSLMSPKESEARGRVVVDPCHRDSCQHVRQIHVFITRIDPHLYGGGNLPPITACLVCGCGAFVEAEF